METATATAFVELIEEELPGLLRRARKLTSTSPLEPEDLVQNTLERAFKKFHQFEEGTCFGAWLMTIMRHIWHDSYKREIGRHEEKGHSFTSLDAMADAYGGEDGFAFEDRANPSPEEYALGEVLADNVVSILDGMSDERREAWLLRNVDHLSQKEIAEIQGIEQGSVGSRVSRARRDVQEGLKERGLAA